MFVEGLLQSDVRKKNKIIVELSHAAKHFIQIYFGYISCLINSAKFIMVKFYSKAE